MFQALFTQPLYNILILIYAVIPGHDLGVAIILITILIRIILWPFQSKQFHSQKAMQKLQPEIAKVRKKAKGDKAKESQMLMELYREKEINPFGACLPSLIQFPFMIALFLLFRSWLDIEHIKEFTYSFVQNLSFVKNVVSDPSLFSSKFLGFLDLSLPNKENTITNLAWFYYILPLMAGILQFVQSKMLVPKQQDQTQKMMSQMMYIFPLMIIFFGATLPMALSLFWVVSTAIAVLQQYLIMHKDIEIIEKVFNRRENKLNKKGGK